MKISFIRGSYLNNFEGQNFPSHITGYSSLFPIDSSVEFPLVKLPSFADFQKIPLLTKAIKYIANRTLGDSQILFGLEKHITNSDIVHIGDPHYYYSYQTAVLKSKGLIHKLVSTWWETIPFNNESTTAKKRIKKFTMKQVDRFICYTEKAKECLITEGISEDKISLIPLGVNTSNFHPSNIKNNNTTTILFVGRLVEEKGVMDLYHAFKCVAAQIRNIKLIIVGNGPLQSTLQNNIKKDNLGDVISIQHKSYKEMPELFRIADILCVPSKRTPTWEEQYGMVFIEAMASGLPILSYKTGVISQVVQNAGILHESGDTDGLTKSLLELAANKQLCTKLGTIGRERAEKVFNAQNTKKYIETFYTQL